jgi:hypothetical protein
MFDMSLCAAPNRQVTLFERDFSAALMLPVLPNVVSYSHAAIGGPRMATLTVEGGKHVLMSYLDKLRSPVEITDERGRIVWWGYVAEVEIKAGAIAIGTSLETMSNKVAVVYSFVAPGTQTVGTRATTTWATDQTSIDEYGYKELQASVSGATPAQAEKMRDIVLAQRKYPVPTVNPAEETEEDKAILHCRGWWDTLGWRYCNISVQVEAYITADDDKQIIGSVTDNTKCAQSFQLTGGAAWSAYSGKVNIGILGAPADNVILDLCADSAGVPGTVLGSATISAAIIPVEASWVEGVLSVSPALALGTTYWLVIRRSGANDPSNFYFVKVNTALGYTSGVCRLWNGSAWVARSPDADMLFQITGQQETTAQIAAVVAASGQFLAATDIENASGIFSSPYRDGDTTALAEILDLLKSTTSGSRLLTQVTSARRVRVFEEPSVAAFEYIYKRDGTLMTKTGSMVEPHLCPVAEWVRVQDVVDYDMGLIADPSYFFIEEAEYDAATDKLRFQPRGIPSPWDVLTRLQGMA